MLVKFAFLQIHADMLKKINTFETECVLPRCVKRNLPTLPEDKEFNNMELRKCSRLVFRRRRYRRQWRLPVVPESDEC
ncbi:unnamed protein product [Leptidea sinapis]|uniref:Uncharacterized protein n=1 Tax=Leptidea sinapis TaxID=189913 RepID=A0A5E4QB80_9NEOP|nr:unnamed protein product [Leptidea sinapis]